MHHSGQIADGVGLSGQVVGVGRASPHHGGGRAGASANHAGGSADWWMGRAGSRSRRFSHGLAGVASRAMCARRPGSHPCVSHSGDFVIVTGNGNALSAVTAVLARNQIVAYQLRIEHEGR